MEHESLTNDSLIMPGGALKACGLVEVKGKQYGKAQGYGIIFGDAKKTDLAGDWFTAKTYLGAHEGDGADHYLHHGLPIKGFEAKRFHRFMPWTKVKRDDYGVLYETLYDMADDYEVAVYGAVMAGKMGLSSGAVSHLVEREGNADSGEIKTWIIGEISETPCPCEPRTKEAFQAVKATNLKALVETYEGIFDVPQAVADELEELRTGFYDQLARRIQAEDRVLLQRRLISLQIEALHLFDVVS